jgi:hypothetical protein
MTNLILPRKKAINEVEEVVLPEVRCDSCGEMTQTGLHQKQARVVKLGGMEKVNGLWKFVPAVMDIVDLYMCQKCVNSGKKFEPNKTL